MGFCDFFCDMIFECISTVSTSSLLNGLPGETFKPERGLRQGDPLSPYLFIVCMESFSRALLQAENGNHIHGIQMNQNFPSIFHLFFFSR